MTTELFTSRPFCVKCGYDQVTLRFQGVQTLGNRDSEPNVHQVTCNWCGYQWMMLAKDHQGAKK